HGSLGVEAYRDMGYPAEAMRNYLARLGWSHGDDEFFTTEQAVAWFSLDGIGKSPSRFDFKKLENLSGQHIRAMTDAQMIAAMRDYAASQHLETLTDAQEALLLAAGAGLRDRAKIIPDLFEMAHFILGSRPFEPDEKAAKLLDPVSRSMLSKLTSRLQNDSWSPEGLDAALRAFAESEGLKLGKVAQPLRAALTGRTVSPSVFDVMAVIGKTETLARLDDATG
ncbi:MAG: glutamate--tRNA ligase family protein, partial [Pseudomonadota bacterium]